MKMMDEKGRLFGKINLFDLLVILAVLVVIAGVGYKLLSNKNDAEKASNTTLYVATIRCAAVEPGFADALKKDDRLFFDLDNYVNAKIVAVREEKALISTPTTNGALVLAEDPRLLDVSVDIAIDDVNGDGLLKVGRYSVGVGGKFAIKTFYAYAEGVVTAIALK